MDQVQIPLDAFIIDSLMPDLIGHDRKPAALVVYLFLYRRAHRAPTAVPAASGPAWSVRLSHQAIAESTGLSRSAVQSALRHLHKRELITSTRAHATAVPAHKVHRPWQRLSRFSK